jgi:hypothetical protein
MTRSEEDTRKFVREGGKLLRSAIKDMRAAASRLHAAGQEAHGVEEIYVAKKWVAGDEYGDFLLNLSVDLDELVEEAEGVQALRP